MRDEEKTREQLINELQELRKKMSRLEYFEVNKNKIKKELKLFKTLVETSHEAIAVSDADGNLIYINPAHEKLFGYTLEEAQQLNYRDYYPKESIDILDKEVAPALARGEGWSGELDVFDRNGRRFPLWEQADSICDADGNMRFAFGFMHDISKQKQSEEQVKFTLKEKETLLQELYHRTKNNMQVIRSILGLQAAYTGNEEVKKIVRETEYRIQAMAMVHQMLYQSKNLSEIDLNEYVINLSYFLMQGFGVSIKRVTLKFDIQPLVLVIDIAIPVGLILNELLSNALKHAFPGVMSGQISIKIQKSDDDMLHFHFTDNGIGLPANFNLGTKKTLGFRTITSICEHQLRGEVKFYSENGTSCFMKFKDTFSPPRI